jgi:hypothetical protein
MTVRRYLSEGGWVPIAVVVAFPPTSRIAALIDEVGFGARRPVAAAKAERPLCDQEADRRRDPRQWPRRADCGHSSNSKQSVEFDPNPPFGYSFQRSDCW